MFEYKYNNQNLELIFILLQYSDETIFVTKFEMCENSIIKLATTINTIDDSYQLFNGNYSASIPNGENLRVSKIGQINYDMFNCDLQRFGNVQRIIYIVVYMLFQATLKGSLFLGNKWLPIFTLNEEKGVCEMMMKHGGPLSTEVLQSAAVMPRCPIPKVRIVYRVSNEYYTGC